MLKCVLNGEAALSFNPVIAYTSFGSVAMLRSPMRMACSFTLVFWRSWRMSASRA